ncbi:cell division protein FtsZ, partial [Burkholderia cenocepacia]|nr:cell division protein FtsZ [Burkholderia cenocepacia]
MDELTLGLIGAGAVVVGGVVVYNAWQGAKVRRRMPRPMPEEAAEAMNRPERDEELPFIEPVRQPVRREPAAPVAAAPAAPGGPRRRGRGQPRRPRRERRVAGARLGEAVAGPAARRPGRRGVAA